MHLALPGLFSTSPWRGQLGVFKSFSSRTKLLLVVLSGVSLGILVATGVVLRQRRRRYRANSVSDGGGAPSRINAFRRSSSTRGSIPSSHRRNDSFPTIYVIDEDESDSTLGGASVSGGRRRSSVDVSLMEYDSLRVADGEVFLSLSQNNGVLSDEYYDVAAPELEIDSLVTSYPSMLDNSVGGPVTVQGDYLDVSDSDDSFESASESLNYITERHKMYIAALLTVDSGSVKCRTMRTALLHCSGDRDFLAKVHCIRQAFDHLLISEENRRYAIDAGRELILSLLNVSNSDPQPFITRYEEILQFIQVESNWAIAENELQTRGVACLNIYDVALDFMLMDAFDDLSSPPSTLLSVIQNGWISDGIKQSMLNTAVWSILKAKKSILKNKNGFMSKFYLLSETMSPVFAWGFLGTNEELKERCLRFKSGMMSLIQSMFSLEDVRYTSAQSLGEDIMRLTRQTVNSLSNV